MPSDDITQLELCTRFISLAQVGNVKKQKYIYALSLKPVEKMRVIELIQKTTNEIVCPFANLNYKINGSKVNIKRNILYVLIVFYNFIIIFFLVREQSIFL